MKVKDAKDAEEFTQCEYCGVVHLATKEHECEVEDDHLDVPKKGKRTLMPIELL